MSLTKRFNLLPKFSRVILTCFLSLLPYSCQVNCLNNITEYFLMIDLCNKKYPVSTIPWKKLKRLAGISQSPMTCAVKGSEQSALGPQWELYKPHMLQNGIFFHWILSSSRKEAFPSYRSHHLWLSLPARAPLMSLLFLAPLPPSFFSSSSSSMFVVWLL